MQIQIDLEDSRHCDTCKLRLLDEPNQVFNCAMGYWTDDEAETPIDGAGDIVELGDHDSMVFMRPQVCKDNHDTPPGDIYEFYFEHSSNDRKLFRIDTDPYTVRKLLDEYKERDKEYTISGWDEYLTSQSITHELVDEIHIDLSLYF